MGTENLNVKLNKDIARKLDEYVENRGESRSTLVRRLIYRELAEKSYLSEDVKKALGMNSGEEK